MLPYYYCLVVGSVELGELVCDSLALAIDAAALSFVIQDETLIADRASYTFTSGDAFEDGIGVHVRMTVLCQRPFDGAHGSGTAPVSTSGDIGDIEINTRGKQSVSTCAPRYNRYHPNVPSLFP